MKKLRLLSLLGMILWTAPLLAGPEEKSDAGARKILDRVDDLYRGLSSHGKMAMKVKTEHWSREMKIEAWSKGKKKSLMRILSPRKEKGMTTLKSGENIWNYLPKVKRVIKVPSSMMGGSWMGSHFTNDDLVKESRMAEDFTFTKSFEGERDGVKVEEVACIPKADAAVVWGKVVVLVREADGQPLWIKYYDEDLELARTMTFSGFKKFSGRLVPSIMLIVPADKPEEFTQVTYLEMAFDVKLADRLFSLRNLQR